MDNGIYIALSRQNALFRDMEVTANNLANATTSGYNAEKLLFENYLVKDNRRRDAYANDVTSYRDTSSGSIKTTGNPFDLAINGPGYFLVETPFGTRYTKNGNFQIDRDGTLVTAQGYPVLSNDQSRITVPNNANRVVINGIGNIDVDGTSAGQIGLVEFANEQRMDRQGNSLFNATEPATPATRARMAQGAIESSNVSSISELIRVQEISRSVGSTAKFIETMYDLQRKVSSVYTKQTQA
jgi:flagellar basal-body rod protein FlgF